MSFETDGYIIAPIFQLAEIRVLREELAAYLDRLSRTLLLPLGETAPGAPFEDRIERIAAHDPSYARLLGAAIATDAHRGEQAQKLALDPRLSSAAEALLGARIAERTIRLRGNSSTLPEHRSHWHSDIAIDDGGACASVKLAAWIPLTDAGPETGGLELATGRRTSPLPHEKEEGRFIIPDRMLANAPKSQPTIPAGSLLLMDRYLPHRALPNLSGKTRWSLVVWMKTA